MAMNGLGQDRIIALLTQIIGQAAPTAVAVAKYGGTLYTVRPDEKEGQFCGVFAYKDHVQLAFSNGAALKDPKAMLTGTGRLRRHINFASAAEVDAATLTDLLQSAVAHSVAACPK